MKLQRLQDESRISKDQVTKWTTDSDLPHDPFTVTIVTSSVQQSVAFAADPSACEMKLLAKDGIYLNDAPRNITMVLLSPGNRADVAVRCHSVGEKIVKIAGDVSGLYPTNGKFDPKDDQYDTSCPAATLDPNDPLSVEHLMGSFSDPSK